MKIKISSFLGIFTSFLLFFSGAAHAVTSTVAPAFVRLDVSTQQPTATANVAITNNEDFAQTYNTSITDIDVATGSLLPLNSAGELTKKLLQTNLSTISVEAKKSAVVTITAHDFDLLPPGGHYAALKIEPIITAVKPKVSNIQQAFSVPIFVTKLDGAIRTLQATIDAGPIVNFGTLPKVSITIKNTGNVDGVPRGFVSFVRGSQTYQKTSFNDTSVPLFANQQHTFDIAAPHNKPKFIGRYSLVVSYKFDGQENPTIYTQTGWLVPWWFIWLFVILVLFITLLVRHRYKKTSSKSQQNIPIKAISQERDIKPRKVRPKETSNQAPLAKKTIKVSEFGSTKGIK